MAEERSRLITLMLCNQWGKTHKRGSDRYLEELHVYCPKTHSLVVFSWLTLSHEKFCRILTIKSEFVPLSLSHYYGKQIEVDPWTWKQFVDRTKEQPVEPVPSATLIVLNVVIERSINLTNQRESVNIAVMSRILIGGWWRGHPPVWMIVRNALEWDNVTAFPFAQMPARLWRLMRL